MKGEGKVKGKVEGKDKGHGKKIHKGMLKIKNKNFGIYMHAHKQQSLLTFRQAEHVFALIQFLGHSPTLLNFTIKLCAALVASIPQAHLSDTFIASFSNYNMINHTIIGLYQHLYNLS